jgi:hypothetical protein
MSTASDSDSLTTRCLRAFPRWLEGLAEDALLASATAERADCPEPLREAAEGALLALNRGLQLIPQEIADVGYLELAFLLRTAAALGLEETGTEACAALPERGRLQRLAQDTGLLHDFLGRDQGRMERRVRALMREARSHAQSELASRSADSPEAEPSASQEAKRELLAWASRYAPPSFDADEKNIVKLQAFLLARLPT